MHEHIAGAIIARQKAITLGFVEKLYCALEGHGLTCGALTKFGRRQLKPGAAAPVAHIVVAARNRSARHPSSRQSDIRSLARDDLKMFGSESVTGAVLQGPGARESMRQKMPCVKRTRRGFF